MACTWREALGPAPLERLREMALAGVDGEHRSHDYRAVTVGDLEAGSIDGSLIRVPDTPANRAAFGSAGTAAAGHPAPPWPALAARLLTVSSRARSDTGRQARTGMLTLDDASPLPRAQKERRGTGQGPR